MPDPAEKFETLWRGSDPAKFTALQAALREEGIPFWNASAYDPAGGFLSSRPFYLEASPGFEIRVRAEDHDRALGALAWLNDKAAGSAEALAEELPSGEFAAERGAPALPQDWDAGEATEQVWSGQDEAFAEYLASVLRENGIPSLVPDEPGGHVPLRVRPVDAERARQIVGEVAGEPGSGGAG